MDAFELWYWRRLLRVTQTSSRSNESIKKESVLNILWKDWCWSWNSNTLATWCKELTHWKKTLMLGKIKGRRRKRWQRIRWLDSITNSTDTGLRKLQEIPKDREAWCASVHEVTKSQTRLSDWTELNWRISGSLLMNVVWRLQKLQLAHCSFFSWYASVFPTCLWFT